MDQADRYRQLALLGRDAFLASAAPAALVRRRLPDESTTADRPLLVDDDETLAAQTLGRRRAPADLEVYPLIKKPGAPFAEAHPAAVMASVVTIGPATAASLSRHRRARA